MNMIEKQTELGKSLYEINTSTMKSYMSMQRENIEKYIELNREFGTKLPEVKDFSSAVELQREYNETLWSHTKSAIEAQNELLKGAFGNTTEALKEAYTPEGKLAEILQDVKATVTGATKAVAEEVAVEAPKAKAKAKAKVKKVAKKAA